MKVTVNGPFCAWYKIEMPMNQVDGPAHQTDLRAQ